MIDLLLGLLPLQELPRKHHRDGHFCHKLLGVVAGNFALSFSLKFLSIFGHISGSIEPMTLIWVSLKICFPPAEVKVSDILYSIILALEGQDIQVRAKPSKRLERFSFERRKVIGFAITMPNDWLKKLAPHFHPIRSKTKTNRNSLARVFPRFASATCNYYEF